MSTKRSLLEVLKAELEFVVKGGYRNTARVPWRPQFIFQDSPTCLNFDPTRERRPCTECSLMDLIPREHREGKIPCRHIQLNEKGEQVVSFYRGGTDEELEVALVRWLTATIARLEAEKPLSGAQATAGRATACGKEGLVRGAATIRTLVR